MRRVVVDFDGTLVEFAFPAIGVPRWDIINLAKQFKELGFEIVVSSSRASKVVNPSAEERTFYVTEMIKFLDSIAFPYDWVDQGDVGKIPCLTGDTRIPTLDGSESTILELIDRINHNEDVWVYSICGGLIVPNKVLNIVSQGVKDVKNITLDNGKSFSATHEQLVMRRSGEFIKVSELVPDISLMPLYRRLFNYGSPYSYEEVYVPLLNVYIPTHIISMYYERREGEWIRHHKNFLQLDNNPTNLEWMDARVHFDLHRGSESRKIKARVGVRKYHLENKQLIASRSSKQLKEQWRTDRERLLKLALSYIPYAKQKAQEKFRNDPVFRKKVADQMRKTINALWQNSEFRAMRSKISSETMKRQHQDPNFRQQCIERINTLNSDPEFLRKSIERLKLLNSDPEFCRKRLEGIRESNSDPKIQHRRLETMRKPEYREKQRINMLSYWQRVRVENARIQNHTVISSCDSGSDLVYDLILNRPHNFAISAGVFVHNCNYYIDDRAVLAEVQNIEEVLTLEKKNGLN